MGPIRVRQPIPIAGWEIPYESLGMEPPRPTRRKARGRKRLPRNYGRMRALLLASPPGERLVARSARGAEIAEGLAEQLGVDVEIVVE